MSSIWVHALLCFGNLPAIMTLTFTTSKWFSFYLSRTYFSYVVTVKFHPKLLYVQLYWRFFFLLFISKLFSPNFFYYMELLCSSSSRSPTQLLLLCLCDLPLSFTFLGTNFFSPIIYFFFSFLVSDLLEFS